MNKPASTWLHSAACRFISLALAVSLSLFILIGPQHIATAPEQLAHGSLSLLMVSLCVLFVHGLGWQFHSAALRYLVSPLTLWPLTLLFTLMTLQLI